MWRAAVSFARARAGDKSAALAIVSELTALAQRCYVSPYDLAVCCAGIGETDAALGHLEDADRQRVMRVISIGDPEFDSLRGEPRFVLLLKRLRLPRCA